jgi:hypothetical protein
MLWRALANNISQANRMLRMHRITIAWGPEAVARSPRQPANGRQGACRSENPHVCQAPSPPEMPAVHLRSTASRGTNPFLVSPPPKLATSGQGRHCPALTRPRVVNLSAVGGATKLLNAFRIP